MTNTYLEFENELAILESKIKELLEVNTSFQGTDLQKEIDGLNKKHASLLEKIYNNLTPWQKVLVARHPERPHALDYIEHMCSEFVYLAGDRLFAEDQSVISGIGIINGISFVILGIIKGNDLESRVKYNFGMPKPEGYRKGQRLVKLAEKLQLPVLTLLDTSGAYPGQEAEERGQGEAIAKSIQEFLKLSVPSISVVIGEGGSGGAIAFAATDRVMMLEHAVYSVISPEGCASILWKNEKMAEQVSQQLGLTAQQLLKCNIIDELIKEPVGGAHRNKELIIQNTKNAILVAYDQLIKQDPASRKQQKHNKFLNL